MGTNAESYFGRGMKLNGINQNVSLESFGTQSSDTCTYFVDISTQNNVSTQVVFRPDRFYCWIRPGKDEVALYVYNGVTVKTISYSFPTITTEYTLGLIISNAGFELFINGLSVYTFVGTIHYNITYTIHVGSRNGAAGFFDGVVGNFQMVQQALTPAQIQYQYEYPETFLYREDGVLKSKILNQDEINNVKVFMPMVDTDRYARNLAAYSEGRANEDVTSWLAQTSGESNTNIDDGNGNSIIHNESATNTNYHPRLIFYNSNYTTGDMYLIKAIVTITYGTAYIKQIEVTGGGVPLSINETKGVGTYTYYYIANSWSNLNAITFDGQIETTFDANVSVETYSLTGVYEISNYTNSVRDAINLPTGLQTSKWKRDLLGVPNGLSSGLECDGVGYLDTGWIPDVTKDFTIEIMLDSAKNTFGVSGFDFGTGKILMVGTNKNALYVNLAGNLNTYKVVGYGVTYITVIYDVGSYSIYINGVFYETVNMTKSFKDGNLFYLGCSNRPILVNFHITPIKLFKVHPKAMTAQEVKYRYNTVVPPELLN